MGNKAVFFDRDGVLNVDVHYLHKKEDFVWVDGAPEAVKYCNDHGYRVIVITNQSGVARGYYTEQDIAALHDWMNEQLQQWGAHIDAFYYCPHHPQGTVLEYTRSCNCR
ncbi:MAG: D-glycero-alpha-D-manno-heptose-1,7-bisphosphate 7-phosphatase, partial [Selenomonadaceae bacterium]